MNGDDEPWGQGPSSLRMTNDRLYTGILCMCCSGLLSAQSQDTVVRAFHEGRFAAVAVGGAR